MTTSRQVRVAATGGRKLTIDDFQVMEVDLAEPAPGEVQIENQWMSVDPYMKDCLIPGSRLIPDSVNFFPDRPLPASAVGTVTESAHPDFVVGDRVLSMLGWRDRWNAQASELQKIDVGDLSDDLFLGPLGLTGLMAYVGMRFLAIKPGETVFVSAAAGAAGSTACQIAKMRGARVIGSAGSPQKLSFLKEIGVDATIDYRATPDLLAALKAAAPDGIDAYFDNVGGQHLAAAVDCARPFARIVLGGVIGQDENRPVHPNLGLAIPKHIMFQGFSTRYYLHELPAVQREMAEWIRAGHIKSCKTVEHGIDAAPTALFRLLKGENVGKMMVRLA